MPWRPLLLLLLLLQSPGARATVAKIPPTRGSSGTAAAGGGVGWAAYVEVRVWLAGLGFFMWAGVSGFCRDLQERLQEGSEPGTTTTPASTLYTQWRACWEQQLFQRQLGRAVPTSDS